MRLWNWPLLLAGATLLLVGGWRLLGEGATSQPAAGALLGAGLLAIGIWIASEIDRRQ